MSGQTSVVRLVDPNDIIDKVTYALTSPLNDGLVDRIHHWPGVTSLESVLHGRPLVARRPAHFFRKEGAMPEAVSLRFPRPRGFEDLTGPTFRELVLGRVRAVEERMAAERRRTGALLLGRRAVLAQKWSDRPDTREPRRQLSPRVAARSIWSRIEALLRNRAFRDAYTAARERFVAGMRDVVFPAGTYWLRRFTHVVCAPWPEPG